MSKINLRKLGPSTWVMEGPTNIGFIKEKNDIFLVDSGNDKDSGRKINKILKENGWNLKAVINTHSNADHIGGNDYLQRNLGCNIVASAIENMFIEFPKLESTFLWGGLEIKDLHNKFFQAKASNVTTTIHNEAEISEKIKTIFLPGHYFNMIGVETEDNVLFIADCMFGKEILEKYKLPFIYDVKGYKATIEKIRRTRARYFVPSHGHIVEDIQKLADINISIVEDLEEHILELLREKKNYDVILKAICNHYGIQLDYGQYALIGCTIRSFLSYLYNDDKIQYEFIDNMMFWKRSTK